MSIPYLACLVAASTAFALPPRVLPSIQAVEGGRVGMIHTNANGTADLGVMQVNTTWIRPLAAAYHAEPGTVARLLIDDPCFNIRAAAGIMHVYMREAHNNLLLAVGYYHSHSGDLGVAYRDRVLAAAIRLFAHPR